MRGRDAERLQKEKFVSIYPLWSFCSSVASLPRFSVHDAKCPAAGYTQIFRKGDAVEATRALSRLEAAIPRDHRPDLLRHADNRMQLIDNWWARPSKRAIA